MSIIFKLFGTAGAVLVAAYFVPGFAVDSITIALVVALLLGVIGVTLKPILTILTLPISLLTFGLFSLVINAGILLLLASVVDGFSISNFFVALIAGIIIAAVQWVVDLIV